MQAKNLAVLVVCESPSQRRLLHAYLNRLGHLASAAENLADAVLALEKDSFDTLLLDTSRPPSNQLTQTYRLPGRCHLFVGMVWGPKEIAPAIELGCHVVLVKPVTLASLRQALSDGWAILSANRPIP